MDSHIFVYTTIFGEIGEKKFRGKNTVTKGAHSTKRTIALSLKFKRNVGLSSLALK